MHIVFVANRFAGPFHLPRPKADLASVAAASPAGEVFLPPLAAPVVPVVVKPF